MNTGFRALACAVGMLDGLSGMLGKCRAVVSRHVGSITVRFQSTPGNVYSVTRFWARWVSHSRGSVCRLAVGRCVGALLSRLGAD